MTGLATTVTERPEAHIVGTIARKELRRRSVLGGRLRPW